MNSLPVILDTDAYKASHSFQYPSDMTMQQIYLESRGGAFDKVVFFGIKYLVTELQKGFTLDQIYKANAYFKRVGVLFDLDAWVAMFHRNVRPDEQVANFPVEIRSFKEGTIVPVGTPLMTITSLDKKAPWIVGYLETFFMRIWYPTTVATLSWHIKQVIKQNMLETCDSLDKLPFMLNDFGSRGVSSGESAALGGLAHLVNFSGTDTMAAVHLLDELYVDGHSILAASVPAAEHSTITTWGRDNEREAYENMLHQFAKPGAIVSIVCDSYDLWNSLEKIWGEELKDKVVQSGATVVLRPDSGDPVSVVTKSLDILAEKFGVTFNSKGFKLLKNVRLIQGDGVNLDSIKAILDKMKQMGYSADNICFGMGGALLQGVNRDTLRFAMKTCAIKRGDSKAIPIFKDPMTDPGKRSKPGPISNNDWQVWPNFGGRNSSKMVDELYNGSFFEIQLRTEEV